MVVTPRQSGHWQNEANRHKSKFRKLNAETIPITVTRENDVAFECSAVLLNNKVSY